MSASPAHHRHRLGAGRAHRHQFGADAPRRLRPPRAAGRVRLTTMRSASRRGRDGSGLVGAQDQSLAGQRHRADRWRRHRSPARHAPPSRSRASPYSRVPSTGSTIHTAALAQPRGVVLFLLRQQPVIGPLLAQGMAQELVGGRVPGLAQRLQAEHAARAHGQSAACPSTSARWAASSASVMGHRAPYFSGINLRMICAAASCAVISTVLMRISGLSGRFVGAVDPGEVLELHQPAPFCKGPSRRALPPPQAAYRRRSR